MAKGSVMLNSDANITGALAWNSSVNTAANSSNVGISIVVSTSSPSYLGSWLVSVEIKDGDTGTVLAKDTTTYTISYTGTSNTVYSKNLNVVHNADGTKNIIVTATCLAQNYFMGTSTPAGGTTITLDTIIRQPEITSAPNFTDEDNPTIKYTNPMGEHVQLIEACIATENGSSVIIGYREIDKNGTEYTFNFTDSERTQLRNLAKESTTYPVRFYIESVINGVTYHSYSAVRTLTINVDGPVVTVSVLDTNSTTFNLTGDSNKMIRGANAMLCQLDAVGQKNATIVEQTITCGANTRSGSSTVFENAESNVFIFTAKDSRGLVTTKTVTVPMISYIKPTCNQTVTMVMESSSTTQAEFTATGNYFNGNFGAANNTIKLESRRREDGGSWSAWADITILINDISNNTYTASGNMTGLDASGTYEFQFRVTDKIMSVESTIGTFTLKPIFDWSKTDFNFNVPVTIQDNPLNDFVIETGTASMGSNGTWYWRKWKSGRAECYGCRNFGSMAVTTTWGNLYRSAIFTQSLPTGLFTAVPEVIDIAYRTGSSGGWIVRHENSLPTASDSGSFILVRPASATLSSSYIGFNVIGRWK